MRTIIEQLCAAGGVSGMEDTAAFASLVSPWCETFSRDPLGNLTALRRGSDAAKPTVMLEAHADKIGLMIRHITADGFLLFSPVGGFDTKLLPTCVVRIYGRKTLTGVICTLPPHIAKSKKAPDIKQLCIDTGYTAAQLQSLVAVGDRAEFVTEFSDLHGDMVAAGALDDRAGLAVLVRVLQRLGTEELPFNVAAVAAVQEEVGTRGAGAAAYRLQPHTAICVDVCHGKTPDGERNAFKMGGGPVITVGPNVQRPVSNALIRACKAADIAYQTDVDSGDTGTDAWVVQPVRRGVYTGLVSLPLRYMHAGYEVLNVSDATHTADAIHTFLLSCKKEGLPCY